MGIFRRIYALSVKEVMHILRDPRSLYLALGMPVVMILLFGFGVSFDLDGLPVAFVDHDESASSRELRRRFMATPNFEDAGLIDEADAEGALVAGDAVAVLIIAEDFEAGLRRGDAVTLQLLVDGSDNNAATQARAKAETVAQVLGAQLVSRTPSMSPPVSARTWNRFNPNNRSAVFLLPGIAGFVLAMVAVMLTALTVAQEWERGSMAQLFATPVSRLEIVVGKLFPYVILGILATLLVIAVGVWVFEMPFRGSASTLSLLSLLFLLGMLGQGLLISVITRNQMVATQTAVMSGTLPSMLLSGFVFPIENMPEVLQTVSYAIPARYYIEGMRGVLLRGNGLEELWPEAVSLAIYALLMIALSTLRFRRTIA